MSQPHDKKPPVTIGTKSVIKVKLMAPSSDGGADREVSVVYERKAEYGLPSFLKTKM
ncbi:hypothetical protein [Cohnella phaseoli]|uniref:hypothetical protein n=1 Tax=Cohnella phaseoli TaxID=456490 RepID=UPI0015F283B2|nr:hypothetical protein [Cohnella phaseoli]